MTTLRLSVVNVGDLGIFHDVPGHALPPNAWTRGLNVRFEDGVVRPAGRNVASAGPMQIPPYWSQYMVDYWVYAGAKSSGEMGVWTIDPSSIHVELTTGDGIVPSWTPQARITGGMINSNLVISNTVTPPAYWAGFSPTVEKLKWLPWDDTNTWQGKNWAAAAIRPFKRWLFALGPIEEGIPNPRRIRNSAAAPPNTIPATWDDTDTENDASFIDDASADRYDFIDGLALGDEFVAATEQTVWIGQATGIPDAPFRFRKVFDEAGVLSTDCMVTSGRLQFMLTQNDLVVHDGSKIRSILEGKSKRWLFSNIEPAHIDSAFIFYSPRTGEVWVCFPELGATHCTIALSVNMRDGEKVGIREIPALRHIDIGADYSDVQALLYQNSNFTIQSSTFPHTRTSTVLVAQERLGVSPDDLTGLVNLKHYASDPGPTSDPFGSVEREHLTFPPESRGELQDTRIKRCTAVYPTFSRQPDGPVYISVGTSVSAGGIVSWSPEKVYDARTTRDGRVPFRQEGRSLSIKFRSNGDWQLSGYDLDIVPLGYRS